MAGLADAGVALHSREVGDFQMHEARAATLRMFASDPPDGLFVANDHMALAVLDTLRFELGLSVPGDVSVLGFDDVPAAAWPAYNLTTVRQQANRMVEQTVQILLAKIDDIETPARRVELDGPLIVRGTARIPEGWTHARL